MNKPLLALATLALSSLSLSAMAAPQTTLSIRPALHQTGAAILSGHGGVSPAVISFDAAAGLAEVADNLGNKAVVTFDSDSILALGPVQTNVLLTDIDNHLEEIVVNYDNGSFNTQLCLSCNAFGKTPQKFNRDVINILEGLYFQQVQPLELAFDFTRFGTYDTTDGFMNWLGGMVDYWTYSSLVGVLSEDTGFGMNTYDFISGTTYSVFEDHNVDSDNILSGDQWVGDGDGNWELRGDLDWDNDGIPNDEDFDMDGDGIANDVDPDRDGDGTPNEEDAGDDVNGLIIMRTGGPQPPPPHNRGGKVDTGGTWVGRDSDGDGIPDHEDTDMDGDGVPNIFDGGDALSWAYHHNAFHLAHVAEWMHIDAQKFLNTPAAYAVLTDHFSGITNRQQMLQQLNAAFVQQRAGQHPVFASAVYR